MRILQKLKKYSLKVSIRPSFWILFFIMIALGKKEQFFIILSFVTLHECMHVLVAFFSGLKVEKIILTPIGETAIIKNLEQVSFLRRLLILAAGPMSNIFIGVFLNFFDIGVLKYTICVNFMIGFFNLLPIYPLDGGKILQYILGRCIGMLASNRILVRISSFISIVLVIIGIIQLTLFPYNISIFCIGVYFIKTNKREYINMTYEFYRTVLLPKKADRRIMPIKSFFVGEDVFLKNLIYKISYDYYTYFFIDGFKYITEKELIYHIKVKGIQGKACDIIKKERKYGRKRIYQSR